MQTPLLCSLTPQTAAPAERRALVEHTKWDSALEAQKRNADEPSFAADQNKLTCSDTGESDWQPLWTQQGFVKSGFAKCSSTSNRRLMHLAGATQCQKGLFSDRALCTKRGVAEYTIGPRVPS